MKKRIRKILSAAICLLILFTSFLPLINAYTFPIVKEAYGQESCTPESIGDLRNYLSARVGGVSLDQAAVFLADMSTITGAYYDQDQDRIVFVGQKNTSLHKF